MKKQIIAKICLYTGILSLTIGLGMLFTERPSAAEIAVIEASDTPVVEEMTEENSANNDTIVVSTKKTTTKKPVATPSATPTPTATPTPKAVEAEEPREVKIELLVSKSNITKISGEAINLSDFGPSVILEGTDVTNTCSISIDTSKVGSETGKYDVVLTASCEGGRTAKRYAIVNIYKPTLAETPKAENKQDTSSAIPAPETPIVTDKNGNETRETRAAQEMTKVTIVFNDGSVKTFVKTEVENIYATQIERKMVEAEMPSNYKIEGNTLTIKGNTFVAE